MRNSLSASSPDPKGGKGKKSPVRASKKEKIFLIVGKKNCLVNSKILENHKRASFHRNKKQKKKGGKSESLVPATFWRGGENKAATCGYNVYLPWFIIFWPEGKKEKGRFSPASRLGGKKKERNGRFGGKALFEKRKAARVCPGTKERKKTVRKYAA